MKIETRKGLWVSSSFTEKFGNEDITAAKEVPSFKTLPRSMNDAEIRSELGIQECTLEDVAAFLENPPEGIDDGYANLFYVRGLVLSVFWDGDRPGWGVYAYRLDGLRWFEGDRAFSGNLKSDPLPQPSESLSLEFSELAARVEEIEAILKHHNLGL